MPRPLRLLLLAAALLALQGLRGAVPLLPAPKCVVEGAARPVRPFRAVQADDDAAFRAVLDEIEALADPTAAATLVLRIDRSAKAALAFCRAYAPEAPRDALEREFYGLRFAGDTIRIVAPTEAGGRHALQTLKQLLRTGHDREATIADWCDLRRRIFMDDISRGAVPTMEQVKRQIRDLAELKYNAMMFYVEHTIRVASHPDFAPEEGCFTLDQVREIGRYAAAYGIELIGNFQSFGHFEQILAHPRYRALGDTETMISTTDPAARRFLEEVIGELCDAFPSRFFNVNCDETWDIGNGRSRERVAAIGKERFYADHLRFLHGILRRHGKTMMLWADMVLKYPKILDLLPRDVVLLTWNYDAREEYAAWIEPLRGHRLLVCPGVHSSGRLVPDLEAADGNRRFIAEGYARGAEGALLTSWDEGALHSCHHLCLGIAQAAETMWDTRRTTADADFDRRYELLRFGAANGVVGACRAMMRLGDLPLFNGMNDRIFYQRFTPEPGRPLNIDREQLLRADSIARRCAATLRLARADRNRAEIEAGRYAAESYRFIARSRLGMARIAALYERGGRNALVEAVDACDRLLGQVQALERRFARLWLYENRLLSYDRGREAYAEKRAAIRRIRTVLEEALRRLDRGQTLRTAAEAGLETHDRRNAYMCFWLTTGPFTGFEPEEDILAEAGGEAAVEPTPGLRFRLGRTEYKWTKTESLNGLTMDGNACCPSGGGATFYAYAQLTSDRDRTVDLLVGHAGRLTLFCNGERLDDGAIANAYAPDSRRIALPLRAGTNRLVVKLRQEVPEWLFSCIVEGASVASRKHKYTLTDNPEKTAP